MVNQNFRQQIGLLFELVELLEKNEEVLNHDLIKRALKKLGKDSAKSWNNLMSLTQGHRSSDAKTAAIRKAIEQIRHNGSFHYYQTKTLRSGLESHFKRIDKTNEHENALYLSAGKNFEETRFYFSDAAITSYNMDIMEKYSKNFMQDLKTYINSLHVAIWGLIAAYLNVKQVRKVSIGDVEVK